MFYYIFTFFAIDFTYTYTYTFRLFQYTPLSFRGEGTDVVDYNIKDSIYFIHIYSCLYFCCFSCYGFCVNHFSFDCIEKFVSAICTFVLLTFHVDFVQPLIWHILFLLIKTHTYGIDIFQYNNIIFIIYIIYVFFTFFRNLFFNKTNAI